MNPTWRINALSGLTAKYYYGIYPSSLSMDEIVDLQMAGKFPHPADIGDAIVVAIAMTLIRYFMEFLIFQPLGKIAMKLDFSTKNEEKIKANKWKLFKWREACWRSTLYLFLVGYGFYSLYDADWFYNFDLCWTDYPKILNQKNYWYYMLGLGTYLHLLICQVFDPPRTDFWEMFLHHLVTLGLIFLSYITHFLQIGTLIMLLHDISDPFLELAKVFNYMSDNGRPKLQVICDSLFVCFALTFFILRLIIYPFWILHQTIYMSWEAHGSEFRAWHICNTFLIILQILHIYWFALIGKMIYKFVVVGKVEKDIREKDD